MRQKTTPAPKSKALDAAKAALAQIESAKHSTHVECEALETKREQLLSGTKLLNATVKATNFLIKKKEEELVAAIELNRIERARLVKITAEVGAKSEEFSRVAEDIMKSRLDDIRDAEKWEKARDKALAAREQELAGLNVRIAAATDARDALRVDTEKLSVDGATKAEQVKILSAEISALGTKKASLAATVVDGEEAVKGMNKTIVALHGKTKKAERAREAANRRLSGLADAIEEAFVRKDGLDNEIYATREVLLTQTKRIQTIERREADVRELYRKAGVTIK